MLPSRAFLAAPSVSEGPCGHQDLTPPSPHSILVSLHQLICVLARSSRGNGCHRHPHLHCHTHWCVVPPIRRLSRVQAAPLASSNITHHVCLVRLFQISPRHRGLVCQRIWSVVFFAKPSHDAAQLHGFLGTPSYSSGLASDAMHALWSIQHPESITAICFSIAVVYVNLMCCFCFAKTFVDDAWSMAIGFGGDLVFLNMPWPQAAECKMITSTTTCNGST